MIAEVRPHVRVCAHCLVAWNWSAIWIDDMRRWRGRRRQRKPSVSRAPSINRWRALVLARRRRGGGRPGPRPRARKTRLVSPRKHRAERSVVPPSVTCWWNSPYCDVIDRAGARPSSVSITSMSREHRCLSVCVCVVVCVDIQSGYSVSLILH